MTQMRMKGSEYSPEFFRCEFTAIGKALADEKIGHEKLAKPANSPVARNNFASPIRPCEQAGKGGRLLNDRTAAP
jgi:hypothetical protein